MLKDLESLSTSITYNTPVEKPAGPDENVHIRFGDAHFGVSKRHGAHFAVKSGPGVTHLGRAGDVVRTAPGGMRIKREATPETRALFALLEAGTGLGGEPSGPLTKAAFPYGKAARDAINTRNGIMKSGMSVEGVSGEPRGGYRDAGIKALLVLLGIDPGMRKEALLGGLKRLERVASPFFRHGAAAHAPNIMTIKSPRDVTSNLYHATEGLNMGHAVAQGGNAMAKARGVKDTVKAGVKGLRHLTGTGAATAPTATSKLLGRAGAAAWAADMAADGATQMFKDPETGKWNTNVGANIKNNAERVADQANKSAWYGRLHNGLMNPVQNIMAAGSLASQTDERRYENLRDRMRYKESTGAYLDPSKKTTQSEVDNQMAYINKQRAARGKTPLGPPRARPA